MWKLKQRFQIFKMLGKNRFKNSKKKIDFKISKKNRFQKIRFQNFEKNRFQKIQFQNFEKIRF